MAQQWWIKKELKITYFELLLLAIGNRGLNLSLGFQSGNNILVLPSNFMGYAAHSAVLRKKRDMYENFN